MQREESSAVVLFRALVMLACLILVPMAAVFGSAFPDVVRKWLVEPVMSQFDKGAVQQGLTSQGAAAPAQANARQPDSPWLAPPEAAAAESGSVAESGSPAMAAEASKEPSGAPSQPFAEPGATRQDPRVAAPATALLPATPRGAAGNPTVSLADHQRAADQPDRFSTLERRLRELGAAYYALESWGDDGQLYRFHCKMPLVDDPRQVRQFEAVDADALVAIRRVAADVEKWRADRPLLTTGGPAAPRR
jgi:hypothetical protein